MYNDSARFFELEQFIFNEAEFAYHWTTAKIISQLII